MDTILSIIQAHPFITAFWIFSGIYGAFAFRSTECCRITYYGLFVYVIFQGALLGPVWLYIALAYMIIKEAVDSRKDPGYFQRLISLPLFIMIGVKEEVIDYIFHDLMTRDWWYDKEKTTRNEWRPDREKPNFKKAFGAVIESVMQWIKDDLYDDLEAATDE